MPLDKISELAYYYALYHQVAHWAAFVATMGLLINSGIILSASREALPETKRKFCRAFVTISLFGAWFFLFRMLQYGEVVRKILPEHLHEISPIALLNPTPAIIVLGVLATLAIAAADWILIGYD